MEKRIKYDSVRNEVVFYVYSQGVQKYRTYNKKKADHPDLSYLFLNCLVKHIFEGNIELMGRREN